MIPRLLTQCLVVAGTATISVAQTSVVTVPLSLSSTESPSVGQVAGFSLRMRQQIVVDGSLLTKVVGKRLAAMVFRRDLNDGDPLAGSTSKLTITLSTTAVRPTQASPVFAANRGANAVRVLSAATVTLPTSPGTTDPIAWTPENVARIAVAPTFAYQSGSLCIEIEGEPTSSPAYWPVDYQHAVVSGHVSKYGTGCGFPVTVGVDSADASAQNLAVGGTISAWAFGRPGTPGGLVISSLQIPEGIPLDNMGATGCRLYVRPDLVLPVRHGPSSNWHLAGTAEYALHVPAQTALAGARLVVQWANLEIGRQKSNSLGVTTTNGVQLDISPVPPKDSVTTIETDWVPAAQPFPSAGYVNVGRGPVVRFEFK